MLRCININMSQHFCIIKVCYKFFRVGGLLLTLTQRHRRAEFLGCTTFYTGLHRLRNLKLYTASHRERKKVKEYNKEKKRPSVLAHEAFFCRRI